MTSHRRNEGRGPLRRVPGAIALGLTTGLAITGLGAGVSSAATPQHHQKPVTGRHPGSTGQTATPIKHLVVLFDENVSFDHYFGTYPDATNKSGATFRAAKHTPKVTNLTAKAPGGGTLLTHNPNGANPKRLNPADPADVLTCDQNHDYTPEQNAFDHGKMDEFPSSVGTASGTSDTGAPCKADTDLDYYDGNTVTAEWNYAQHYAMSDNAYGTEFGPSTVGALNVVAGDPGVVNQTSGTPTVASVPGNPTNATEVPDGKGGDVISSDADPYYDDCGANTQLGVSGKNVGDDLNAKGLSWGWFQGGFAPTTAYSGPATTPGQYNPSTVTDRAVCGAKHSIGTAIGGTGQYGTESDYIAHHEPFQYYASTANPHHLAPTSLAAVGTDTQTYSGGQPEWNTANHQYDLGDFNQLLTAIDNKQLAPSHLPAVSYLKAPGYQDGHAGYSDPLDEQQFLTTEINAIEASPDWKSTAIVITYDDSDGWYDQAVAPVNNPSKTVADTLSGTNKCGPTTKAPIGGIEGVCGPGPRLPFLVISPWAKSNYVSSTEIEQSSVVKFIEQNWHLPTLTDSTDKIAGSIMNMFDFSKKGGHNPPLFLNQATGEPLAGTQVKKLETDPFGRIKTDIRLTSAQVSGPSRSGGPDAAWLAGGLGAAVLVGGGLSVRRLRARHSH